jgi:hypothetical protein
LLKVSSASALSCARQFRPLIAALLSRQILALTGQREVLALVKKPAALKPTINQAFNP